MNSPRASQRGVRLALRSADLTVGEPRRRSSVPLACIAVLLCTQACGSLILPYRERPYAPLRLRTSASNETLAAALEHMSHGVGYARVRYRPERSTLTLFRADSAETRERIRIRAADGQVSIAVRSEIRVDGRWMHTREVCAGYGYHRERALALELRQATQIDPLGTR